MSTSYTVEVRSLARCSLDEAVARAASRGLDARACAVVLARGVSDSTARDRVLELALQSTLTHADASTPDVDPVFVTRLLAEGDDPLEGPLAARYPTLWGDAYGGHVGHHNAVLCAVEEECADEYSRFRV